VSAAPPPNLPPESAPTRALELAPELAPELARWRAELSAFDAEVVTSLRAPILRLAAVLPSLGGRRSRPDGEPDGFDGLTRRGDFNHVLTSEWLLADEAPDLFLQRAADGELPRLARAFSGARKSQRSVVLIDTGPDQQGGPRLAHFAALFALAARAAAAQIPFAWGLLQAPDEPLSQTVGPESLRRLQLDCSLNACTARHWADWQAKLAPLKASDDLWLVGGPSLARLETPGARLICDDVFEPGVAAMEVSLNHPAATAHLRLPLPDDARIVSLLRRPLARSGATRSTRAPVVPGTGDVGAAFAIAMALNGERVFTRTAEGVVGHHLPPRAPAHPGEVGGSRRRLVPEGVLVLAAGSEGRRVSVLVYRPASDGKPQRAEIYADGEAVPSDEDRRKGGGFPVSQWTLPEAFVPSDALHAMGRWDRHRVRLRGADGRCWLLHSKGLVYEETPAVNAREGMHDVQVTHTPAGPRVQNSRGNDDWRDVCDTALLEPRVFLREGMALCEVDAETWHLCGRHRGPPSFGPSAQPAGASPHPLPAPDAVLKVPAGAEVIGPLGHRPGLACLSANADALIYLGPRAEPQFWPLPGKAVRTVFQAQGKAVACLLTDGGVVALPAALDRLQVLKNGKFA
jgi:hypothetical protein